MFLATYLPQFMTYVAEPSRKGSSKLVWSAMAADSGPDLVVSWREVPLEIRRAAKAALLG